MLPLSPLLLVASSLIPDLIKIIAGDRAGTVAKEVEQAVKSVTNAQDAPEAREKLADPGVAAALQGKLAQIALDATRQQLEEEDRKRQDALRQWQLQLEADDRLRKDELAKLRESLKADNENTANARDLLAKLMQAGSPLVWVPAWISTIVILFFAIAVCALVAGWGNPAGPYKDLLNICVGALVAGFSTVISYWLGSSQGSRDKDVANRAQATIQATEQQAKPAPTGQAIAVAESPSGATVVASTSMAAPGTAAASQQTPAAKIDKFERCITHVLAAEGGFSNNPDDPGGATNFGITLATLAAWRKRNRSDGGVAEQEVRNLTLTEAKDIYRSDYWNALRCDALPPGVDLVVFDFGVNAGPGRSAKTLQDVLGVLQDGSIGPQTLYNVPLVDAKKIISEFGEKRRQFYRDLPQFPIFGKGWLARVSRIEEAAAAMKG